MSIPVGGDLSGSRPKRRADVAWREIDGGVVIVDGKSSVLHDLSETASFYWERMDGELTVSELAERAVAEFDVDADLATRDLEELIGELEARDLLAPDDNE